MTESVTVGSATIIALSDTEQAYDVASVYPMADDAALERYKEYLTADGKVTLNFGCYVVRVDGRTVLVDTGWGPSYDGQLLQELDQAGVARDSVDAVIFTHLHGDHIGWNITTVDSQPRPTFPRARYLVPEGDWRHYAAQEPRSASFTEQVAPLEQLGVMDLVGGDHVLSPSVTTVATPGHTPGHLSIAVTSGGEHGFILGDVHISLVDVAEPDWSTPFDGDGDLARTTRYAMGERLERDRALIGASHLPKPGLGRFVRVDGRRVWQPV